MPENRFKQMSRGGKAVTMFFFLLFLAVLFEAGAFCLAFVYKITGQGDSTFNQYCESFHPLFTGEPLPLLNSAASQNLEFQDWNQYDPVLGYRNSWTLKTGVYATDQSGFISNGDLTRDLQTKAEGTRRVFILGGSTVAGHGIDHPSNTIPAQLETMLNQQAAQGTKYEVINAGVAGYYSSTEMDFLLHEIMYLRPDLVIALDGFNDLMHLVRYRKVTDKNPRAREFHWNKYHRYLKGYFENPPPGIRLPVRLQLHRYLYSIDILHRLVVQLGARAHQQTLQQIPGEVLEKFPDTSAQAYAPVAAFLKGLEFDAWMEEQDLASLSSTFEEPEVAHYVNNLLFMAGACKERGIPFLAVLQPMLIPSLRPNMHPEEQFHYHSMNQFFGQTDNVHYAGLISSFTEQAGSALLKALGDAFIDQARLLGDEPERVYVDWIHYNTLGCKKIAENLVQPVRSHL